MTARDRGCETCRFRLTCPGASDRRASETCTCSSWEPVPTCIVELPPGITRITGTVPLPPGVSIRGTAGPPSPLLALQARLLEDAAQADRDAGTYERGSYYAGRYHGEAAALRRCAGEIAAMARGDE